MRVAVIGAGPAGVAAVKCCLDEGIEPVCFEKSNDIGGLWHIEGKDVDGSFYVISLHGWLGAAAVTDRTTVMDCTVANVSKEMSCYSDFPPPKHFPIYFPHTYFKQYIHLYAEHFNLRRYIQLGVEVIEVKETADHATTGQWKVKVKDVTSGDVTEHVMEAVLICSGIMTTKSLPTFPGKDTFRGRIIHARDYQNSQGYAGKRVLVVGLGNTAGDVACDVSTVADQVYMSSRSGGWLIPRQGDKGAPLDLQLSRFTKTLQTLAPGLTREVIIKKCSQNLDHELYGLCPQYSPIQSTSLINDELGFRLMSGVVKMKPGVARLEEGVVHFTDGSFINDIDVIICATGYLPDLPFLSKAVIGEDKEQLFLTMFPLGRHKPTLAFVGAYRVKGPFLPIVELQLRYATKIITGERKLPEQNVMTRWIERNIRESRTSRTYSVRGVAQVDFMSYCDELADLIGCKPSIGRLVWSDPRLAMLVMFGPATSYQFRLQGPGAWSGAREAILGQIDRTYYPLTDGKRQPSKSRSRLGLFRKSLLVLAVITAYWCFL